MKKFIRVTVVTEGLTRLDNPREMLIPVENIEKVVDGYPTEHGINPTIYVRNGIDIISFYDVKETIGMLASMLNS